MKATNQIFASAILSAVGMMGIQGAAQADDNRNFRRMEPDEPHQVMQGPQVNQQYLADQINNRIKNQRLRIKEGRRTGALTQREFTYLMREHHEIRQQEHLFLADGFLNPREYATLDRALDKANEQIMVEKHDRDKAHNPPPRPFGDPVPRGH